MSTAAASPAPARPWRSRLALRFSLRTFLAAITIFCILLGWRLHRAKQQRDAVAAIRAAGGWVHYDYERLDYMSGIADREAEPWEPAWLLALLGIDFFHDATNVTVPADRGPAKNFVPHLTQLRRLRSLVINFDDAEMRTVGSFKHLESFVVWSAISDEGVVHLSNASNLRNVALGSSQLSDHSLALLARLPNLERLQLQGSKVTDDGLAVLAGHPNLKTLEIGGSASAISPIGDQSLVHIAQLPQLKELVLDYTRITPAGLKELQKLPHLELLYIRGSTADDLAAVAPLFPNCKVVASRKPTRRPTSSTEIASP